MKIEVIWTAACTIFNSKSVHLYEKILLTGNASTFLPLAQVASASANRTSLNLSIINQIQQIRPMVNISFGRLEMVGVIGLYFITVTVDLTLKLRFSVFLERHWKKLVWFCFVGDLSLLEVTDSIIGWIILLFTFESASESWFPSSWLLSK